MRTLAVAFCCMMLPLMACSCNAPALPATATPAPTATATPTVNPFEPHVTYSPTQPLPTPRPTNTPTPCGTCEPLHPLLYGSVIVHTWEDADGDGEWHQGGDYNEWGTPATVSLMYAGDLPLAVWNVTGVRIPTTWRGIATYTTLLPGLYNVYVYDYEEQRCLVPYHDNSMWAQVQAAGQTLVKVRFWRRPGCYDNGTPTVTPTPRPTATPYPYPCPLYSTNCLPSCPGNLVIDPRGECGPGFVCCVPGATRTVTP